MLLLPEPELEWVPIEPSQDELDFMEYQKYIAWKISGIFGLPARSRDSRRHHCGSCLSHKLTK